MANIRRDAAKLRSLLENIPHRELSQRQSGALRTYISALVAFAEHIKEMSAAEGADFEGRINFASQRLEDAASSAAQASARGRWESVLELAYMCLSTLPGDTGWTPIGPLPPPK